MIKEYIQNLFFSLLPTEKYLGHVKNQQGIFTRYTNEKEQWDIHLDKCKSFICNNLIDKSFNSIAVLGSGWCLDIPVEFLLDHFSKIYLIDIHHPEQIKHKYKKFNQIHFIEFDLTMGMIEVVARNNFFHKKIHASEIEIPSIELPVNADVYLSMNVISQLGSLLFEKINRKFTDPVDESHLSRQLQKNHVNFLKKHSSIFISDTTEIQTDKITGATISKDLIYIQLPGISENWIWPFDHSGNYIVNKKIDLQVSAGSINL